jgi:hypothetical protein
MQMQQSSVKPAWKDLPSIILIAPLVSTLLFPMMQCMTSSSVLHVPGEHNMVADAISQQEFYRAQQLAPGQHIDTIQPPHLFMLGAAKK